VNVLVWQAWGPPGPSAESARSGLVGACFAGQTSSWTPEAEPVVLERLDAVVSSTALRVARFGERRVVSTEHTDTMVSQRLVGKGAAEDQLVARTFLGFTDPGGGAPELVGCFVLCVGELPECRADVEDARVEAVFVPPPPPTLAVRAVVAMAHHPSLTLSSTLTLALLAALVAVATRRRPRTK
jgi:hypothetical protein